MCNINDTYTENYKKFANVKKQREKNKVKNEKSVDEEVELWYYKFRVAQDLMNICASVGIGRRARLRI